MSFHNLWRQLVVFFIPTAIWISHLHGSNRNVYSIRFSLSHLIAYIPAMWLHYIGSKRLLPVEHSSSSSSWHINENPIRPNSSRDYWGGGNQGDLHVMYLHMGTILTLQTSCLPWNLVSGNNFAWLSIKDLVLETWKETYSIYLYQVSEAKGNPDINRRDHYGLHYC